MELLDIVDENGTPTGEIVERQKAHAEGIMHRTSHVWLVRKRNGRIQILLQKRCEAKESFPGCYDVSSAGHIPAGVGFAPSALRELKEELGVAAEEGELIICGNRTAAFDAVFSGKAFHDRQYSRIFALRCELDESGFRLQKDEVSEVVWMDIDEVIRAVAQNLIPNCILTEELQMVKQAVSEVL